MITLFDNYSQESWDLHYSLLSSGFNHPTIVLTDDGFLPEDVYSPYEFFTGFDQVVGKSKFFNEIRVPKFWEITSSGHGGSITDRHIKRATIVFSNPTHKRFVKAVEWLDEEGKVFSIDRYNKKGYRFSQTSFNDTGKAIITCYYDKDGKEVIVENHETGNSILNRNEEVIIFKNKIDFIIYYLKQTSFDCERIIYNSLGLPFLVAYTMKHDGQDILFWQERPREDVPENMLTLLNSSRYSAKVIVQRWDSYTKLQEKLPADKGISYQGYLYPLHRKSGYRPKALIMTNSDQIESLQKLVETLPELEFNIGALTEMSTKLLSFDRYTNVHLFPNMTDETASNLFQECDLYLDINYGNELFNAIRRSFEQSMVLLAFEETVHNKDYVPQQHVFTKDKVLFMVEKIQHMVREQSYWQKCLTEQYNSLKLGNKDGYKKLIDPNEF